MVDKSSGILNFLKLKDLTSMVDTTHSAVNDEQSIRSGISSNGADILKPRFPQNFSSFKKSKVV